MKKFFVILAVAVFAVSCGSDSEEESSPCGSTGEAVRYSGGLNCAYGSNVIGSDFRCPAATPHPFTISTGRICSQDPRLSRAEQREIADIAETLEWTMADDQNVNNVNNLNNANNSNNVNNSNNANTNNSNNSMANNTMCEPSEEAEVCDHLCQTGCEENQKCVLAGNPLATICAPIGSQTQDEVCDFQFQLCAKGYLCLLNETGGDVGTCKKYCRVAAGFPQCDAGQTCRQLLETDTGICLTN